MNILITDKKVTIEQNGLSSAHNVGSLRYHFTDEGDSVTFKDGIFSVTSPVDQITVNGEQMTSANIDLLLDPIFFSADNDDYLKLQSDDAQTIDSDIALKSGKKILLERSDGTLVNGLSIGTYGPTDEEQIEVGSQTEQLNLNTVDSITVDTPDGKKTLAYSEELDLKQDNLPSAIDSQFLSYRNGEFVWLHPMIQSEIDSGTSTIARTVSALFMKNNIDAVKQYTDDQIANLESNALSFKGFISTTQPIEDIRTDNYWYADDSLPTMFPITVSQYNGTDWSAQVEYTPSAFDVWDFAGNAWYYFGDTWNQIDFAGSTFDANQFTVTNGVVSLKESGITNAEIADNAAIEMSKIGGLSDSGDGSLFLSDDGGYKEISQVPDGSLNASFLYWNQGESKPQWVVPMSQNNIDNSNIVPRTIAAITLKSNLDAVKQYTDDQISNLESNALSFKGFISTTQPIEDIRTDNYWYADDSLPTMFPITVSQYNGTDWSAQVEYTPSAFDVWDFAGNAWYYFGDTWNQIDFAGSTFDANQFTVTNGVVSLKESGITNAEIADNAAIEMSKIGGLSDSGDGSLFLSDDGEYKGINQVPDGNYGQFLMMVGTGANYRWTTPLIQSQIDSSDTISRTISGSLLKENLDKKQDVLPTGGNSLFLTHHGAGIVWGYPLTQNNIDVGTEKFAKTISAYLLKSNLDKKANITGATGIIVLTQAEYDAIVTKDPDTLYFVKQ